jgi:hypothetical protein
MNATPIIVLFNFLLPLFLFLANGFFIYIRRSKVAPKGKITEPETSELSINDISLVYGASGVTQLKSTKENVTDPVISLSVVNELLNRKLTLMPTSDLEFVNFTPLKHYDVPFEADFSDDFIKHADVIPMLNQTDSGFSLLDDFMKSDGILDLLK